EEVEHLFQHMRKTLLDIEYLDPQNPDHLLRTFRRLFGDAGLTPRDVRIIRGLMSRMDWINDQRLKGNKGE
ncbi:MAG: RNA methyltransferase, partial [Desulfobacterales bacterium]|nr:RNA methyltransferase [Desulfobacterales bacterium]